MFCSCGDKLSPVDAHVHDRPTNLAEHVTDGAQQNELGQHLEGVFVVPRLAAVLPIGVAPIRSDQPAAAAAAL